MQNLHLQVYFILYILWWKKKKQMFYNKRNNPLYGIKLPLKGGQKLLFLGKNIPSLPITELRVFTWDPSWVHTTTRLLVLSTIRPYGSDLKVLINPFLPGSP